MITKKLFDNYDGREVHIYELSNGKLKVGVTDFGGAIQYLKVITLNGERDVCLGFDNVKDYLKSGIYCGATIGRVANRIGNSKFTLNGKEYMLSENDNGNSLHGGELGFDKLFFNAEIKGDILELSLMSPDGDMGYPGNLRFKAEFELKDSGLEMRYTAQSDKDTLWNPTCHAYFNLSGEGNIYADKLRLYSSKYNPIDGKLIPTGEVAEVKNTPFDFTDFKEIGKDINSDNEQLKLAGGFDHNFVLDGEHSATAIGKSGIRLDVYTDMPGVQFYSGNFIKGNGKSGKLSPRDGFCLEPQYFPNSVNEPRFKPPILKAGETKKHFIKYIFS